MSQSTTAESISNRDAHRARGGALAAAAALALGAGREGGAAVGEAGLSGHARSSPDICGRAQRQVETNQTVDGAAAQTVPRPACVRHDTKCGERAAFVTSDRYHRLPGAQRGVCTGRGRQSVRLEAKHRHIGGWIAPRK